VALEYLKLAEEYPPENPNLHCPSHVDAWSEWQGAPLQIRVARPLLTRSASHGTGRCGAARGLWFYS
jgi:hypothetical protein